MLKKTHLYKKLTYGNYLNKISNSENMTSNH